MPDRVIRPALRPPSSGMISGLPRRSVRRTRDRGGRARAHRRSPAFARGGVQPRHPRGGAAIPDRSASIRAEARLPRHARRTASGRSPTVAAAAACRPGGCRATESVDVGAEQRAVVCEGHPGSPGAADVPRRERGEPWRSRHGVVGIPRRRSPGEREVGEQLAVRRDVAPSRIQSPVEPCARLHTRCVEVPAKGVEPLTRAPPQQDRDRCRACRQHVQPRWRRGGGHLVHARGRHPATVSRGR